MKRNFRLPGPIELHDDVYARLADPMIDHRGPEFAQLLVSVTARLKAVFQTTNDVLMLNCGGTGALEAAVANVLRRDCSVLVISNGFFGDKLMDTVGAYCTVNPGQTPLGKATSASAVKIGLELFPDTDAVYLVHNETSTGVANPIREIAKVIHEVGEVRRKPILFMVDAVSSLGGIDLRTDEWGLDVVVTGSQKALGAPPGLSFVSVSERAWQAYRSSDLPKYYWDFGNIKKAAGIGQPFTTPALPTLYGLDASLDLILKEGLEKVFERHRYLAWLVRSELEQAGFELFVSDPAARSDTVTAVKVPPGVDCGEFIRHLREEFGVHVAGCPGKLNGKVFRIGHMGSISEEDILALRPALVAARDALTGK